MDPALKVITDAAEKDEEYQQIITALSAGKSVKDLQRGHPGWMLKKQWEFLGFQDQYGLIVYHNRIFVLEEARKTFWQNYTSNTLARTKRIKMQNNCIFGQR